MENTIKRVETYAKLAACIGVFGGAAGMILIRNSEASAFTILFYRLLFTALILTVFMLAGKKMAALNSFKNNYKALLPIALFNALSMLFWVFAVKNTSVASAVILSNMHPVLVFFVSMFFFKIKYSKKAILGVFITLIGCVALSASDYIAGGNHIIGDLFAIMAGMSFGSYLLIAKRVREKLNIDVFMFVNYTLSFFYIAIFSIPFRVTLLPMPVKELLIFLCLALFSTLIGQGLVDWGLRYISSLFASLSFLLENVYAIILGIIFLSELPHINQLTWGAVLIAGVLIFNKYEQR